MRGGLEGSKRSGNVRRRVSKLAGEYWWEKGRRDLFGQRGGARIGVNCHNGSGIPVYEHCIAVQDLLDGGGGRCEVPSVMRCQARGSTRERCGGRGERRQNPAPLYQELPTHKLYYSLTPAPILCSPLHIQANTYKWKMRIRPPPPTTSTQPVAPVHVFEAYLSSR